jgi:hypothetical protein
MCVCLYAVVKWIVLQVNCGAVVVSALFPATWDIRIGWFSSAGQENKREYSP